MPSTCIKESIREDDQSWSGEDWFAVSVAGKRSRSFEEWVKE